LIDQVVFHSSNPLQKVRDEVFRECRFLSQNAKYGTLANPSDRGIADRNCRTPASLGVEKTSLAKTIACTQDRYYDLLSVKGLYTQLNVSTLNPKYRISCIALREDFITLLVPPTGGVRRELLKEGTCSRSWFTFQRHKIPKSPPFKVLPNLTESWSIPLTLAL
jgi:hypothetical protein